jgi:hypothetical protein
MNSPLSTVSDIPDSATVPLEKTFDTCSMTTSGRLRAWVGTEDMEGCDAVMTSFISWYLATCRLLPIGETVPAGG